LLDVLAQIHVQLKGLLQGDIGGGELLQILLGGL
jgi:hypothetical protein